jgi:hypothetical protein
MCKAGLLRIWLWGQDSLACKNIRFFELISGKKSVAKGTTREYNMVALRKDMLEDEHYIGF